MKAYQADIAKFEGNVAIDITGAADTCNILSHKKATQ